MDQARDEAASVGEPVALERPADLSPEEARFFGPARREKGRFSNPWPHPPMGRLGRVLRWMLQRSEATRARRKAPPTWPVVKGAAAAFEALEGPTRVLWNGQATFLIESAGARVLIDPIYGGSGPTTPRLTPSALTIDGTPTPDAVLLTHGHFDHCDRPTLRGLGARFGARVPFIVPLGLGRVMPRACERVIEVDWWQQIRIGRLRATFVPAQHWSMRSPFDRNRALWGGWVLEGDHTIYHSGDSGWFDGFALIARLLGPMDVALLPAGAYAPRWFMAPQHLDPEGSARVAALMGARCVIPMHWGTFDLSDEHPDAGLALLEAALRAEGLAADVYQPLVHGGVLVPLAEL